MEFLRRFRLIGYGFLAAGSVAFVPWVFVLGKVSNLSSAGGLADNSTLILLGLLSLVGLLFLFIGVPWTTLVLLFPGKERAQRNFGSTRDAFSAVFLMVLLQVIIAVPIYIVLGIGVTISHNQEWFSPSAMIGPALMASAASMLLALYTRGIRTDVIHWQDFNFSLNGGKNILWGVLGGIVTLAAMSLGEILLQGIGIRQTQADVFPGKDALLAIRMLTFLGGAILAPLIEEIFFRGYVFKGLLLRQGVLIAYIISSLFFSLAHTNLEAILPLFLGGLCLAILYHRTGSLVPPMIAHAINNAIALGFQLFF